MEHKTEATERAVFESWAEILSVTTKVVPGPPRLGSAEMAGAVFLRDAAGRPKAEAGANLPGGEERLEEPRQILRRDAGAVVADRNNCLPTVAADGDADLSPDRGGIHGVVDEVGEELPELALHAAKLPIGGLEMRHSSAAGNA